MSEARPHYMPEPDGHAAARAAMVRDQIAARGIANPAVLAAMRDVPRHAFVPADERSRAHADAPVPLGHGQTVSQPFIVALMTELARPAPSDRALEIGTGSGYQAAVLSTLVNHVYSVEVIDDLATSARDRLARLGFGNVTIRPGDGALGWPELAPFGVILVTAAPREVPPALVAQLGPGGRLVIPVGPAGATQYLKVIEKDAAGTISERTVIPVRFVPLVRGA